MGGQPGWDGDAGFGRRQFHLGEDQVYPVVVVDFPDQVPFIDTGSRLGKPAPGGARPHGLELVAAQLALGFTADETTPSTSQDQAKISIKIELLP